MLLCASEVARKVGRQGAAMQCDAMRWGRLTLAKDKTVLELVYMQQWGMSPEQFSHSIRFTPYTWNAHPAYNIPTGNLRMYGHRSLGGDYERQGLDSEGKSVSH